jgi:hypothetical protein
MRFKHVLGEVGQGLALLLSLAGEWSEGVFDPCKTLTLEQAGKPVLQKRERHNLGTLLPENASVGKN